jgi:anti-sigma B factor antagonist
VSITHFRIEERHEHSSSRLTLTGELDLAAVPVLEARLEELGAERQPVQLDLSELEFIDSTGLHLLVRWVTAAGENGGSVEIRGDLSPPVRKLFELVGVERLIASRPSGG